MGIFIPSPFLVGVELNPGPGAGKNLDEEKKWAVVALIKYSKLSQRDVAKKLKISQKAVWSIWNKYRETNSIKNRPGQGRKRKLSATDEKTIIEQAKKRKKAPEISRMLQKQGKTVSDETVRKTLKTHGYYYLTIQKVEAISDLHKTQRLTYAKEMKNYDWNVVIFTDEKTFCLGSEESHAWQKPGERITTTFTKHPSKLHVWAGMGYYGKFQLYFFQENLDQHLYQQILRSRLKEKKITYAPGSSRIRKKWVFLQDNDPKHKAKKSMELLEELVGTRYIKHPPYSPDLNPMENIWSHLNRKVQEHHVTTIRYLKQVLTTEWKSMPWSVIRSAVDSMPTRLQQCIARNGGRTDY